MQQCKPGPHFEFWTPRPCISPVPSLRDATTGGKNVALRKRDHVVGGWAGALVGDMGVCRGHDLLGGGLGGRQPGAGRGPASTGPLLHTQAGAQCWRPVSALPPSLEPCGFSGISCPLPAACMWLLQCGLVLSGGD